MHRDIAVLPGLAPRAGTFILPQVAGCAVRGVDVTGVVSPLVRSLGLEGRRRNPNGNEFHLYGDIFCDVASVTCVFSKRARLRELLGE